MANVICMKPTTQRIVKKSVVFSSHGKRSGRNITAMLFDRLHAKTQRKQQWFGSVRELMKAKGLR